MQCRVLLENAEKLAAASSVLALHARALSAPQLAGTLDDAGPLAAGPADALAAGRDLLSIIPQVG
jgi:hypothetical protein